MPLPRSLVACVVVLLLAPALFAQGSPSGTLRLYLARHGETAANAERRVLGQVDQPLNARGLAQAEALRVRLRGVRFDAIYSSTLSRSIATASIAGNGHPVRVLASLRERHQGRFQGLLANDQPDFASRMTIPGDDLDGGETTFALALRARQALRSIRLMHPTGSVLIVGHFLLNQMLLAELAALPVERAMRINQANDELYLVELVPGRSPRTWKLIGPGNLGDL